MIIQQVKSGHSKLPLPLLTDEPCLLLAVSKVLHEFAFSHGRNDQLTGRNFPFPDDALSERLSK